MKKYILTRWTIKFSDMIELNIDKLGVHFCLKMDNEEKTVTFYKVIVSSSRSRDRIFRNIWKKQKGDIDRVSCKNIYFEMRQKLLISEGV